MNPLHREFAKEYLETGNGTQAVLNTNPDISNDNSAAVTANRLLRNIKVQQYLENIAEKAVTRIEQLMEQDENLPVALGASKDIMDRAGFKPVEKTELKQNIEHIILSIEEKNKINSISKYE